jgi:hypothetical protein
MSSGAINVDEYGGLYWKLNLADVNYDELLKFIDRLQNTPHKFICAEMRVYNPHKYKIKQKNISDMKIISDTRGWELFNQIKSAQTTQSYTNIIIKPLNSYERLIVYSICCVFQISHYTYKESSQVLVPCTDFLPINKHKDRSKHITHTFDGYDFVCGCNYAPKSFHANHFDNNYDDTISYSYMRRSVKVGVSLSIPPIE